MVKKILLLLLILLTSCAVASAVAVNGTTWIELYDSIDDTTYSFSSNLNNNIIIPRISMVMEYSLYPFVRLNEPTNLGVRVYNFDNHNLIIDDLNTSTAVSNGTSFSMVYDNLLWKAVLVYNESGDVPFVTQFSREGSLVSNMNDVVLKVREFANLTVRLYTSRNLSSPYKDNKGYILVFPYQQAMTDRDMFGSLVTPINFINTIIENKMQDIMGFDIDIMGNVDWYKYPVKVFWNRLNNGVATIELPVGEKYTVKLFSPESSRTFILIGEYVDMYYSGVDYEVQIEKNLLISTDTQLDAVVTEQDTNPVWYWVKWGLFGFFVILLFMLPIIAWVTTHDASVVAKSIVALLVGLPALYGFIVLVGNIII
jgi:hypothetical protein